MEQDRINKNAGSSAFPLDPKTRINNTDSHLDFVGLTKREYFAACAMQGVLANMDKWRMKGEQLKPEEMARISIASADALLIELSKPNS